jgi:hypothetical protein
MEGHPPILARIMAGLAVSGTVLMLALQPRQKGLAHLHLQGQHHLVFHLPERL